MPAEDTIWKDTKLRSSKYLNNMIEQDHRSVKSHIMPMLGFKTFKHAAVTIAGIQLLHRIRKGQFDLGRLGVQLRRLRDARQLLVHPGMQRLDNRS